MTQVHILDAVTQILLFLAFVSFLMFYDNTGNAVYLGFQTCLERSKGRTQHTRGHSLSRLGEFSSASLIGYTE